MSTRPKEPDPPEPMMLGTFKVPPALWHEAQRTVERNGDPSLSHVLRRALTTYVRGSGRRPGTPGR